MLPRVVGPTTTADATAAAAAVHPLNVIQVKQVREPHSPTLSSTIHRHLLPPSVPILSLIPLFLLRLLIRQ